MFLKFPIQTSFCFIGLILGCLPLLFKQANRNGFKFSYLFFFFITFSISFALVLFESSNNYIKTCNSYSTFFLILCGFLMSAGVAIPGVSSTVILMLLGVYNIDLDSISVLNISVLFPMGIGLVLGGLFFMKFIQIMFKLYYSQTFYGIIGFVCSSIFVLYSKLSFNLESFTAIIFLCFGFFIARFFENKIKN